MAGSPIPNNSASKVLINGKAIPTVAGSGSVLSGLVFDSIVGEETSPSIETYRYYRGGVSGDLQATVVVTYSDSTKCFVNSVVRS